MNEELETQEYTTIDLLELISSGDMDSADALLDGLIGIKIGAALDSAREEIAQTLFASTEGEQIEEGNAANKVKKNDAARKTSKLLGRLKLGRSMQKGGYDSVPKDSLAGTNKMQSRRFGRKFAESVEQIEEGNAENKVKKNDAAKNVGQKAPDRGMGIGGRVGDTSHGRTIMSRGRNTDLKTIRRSVLANHLLKKIATRNESVEQIDELSNKTLGSYVNKAASSAFAAGHDSATGKLGSKRSMSGYEKGTKRLAGVRKATSKITKEETEQIDELSNKTLKSYVKKATTSANRNWAKADKEEDNAMSTDGNKHPQKQANHNKKAIAHYDTASKREAGIKNAKAKL